MIKKKLAKKMRQNRPIPHWIRLRTDNTIRFKQIYSLCFSRSVLRSTMPSADTGVEPSLDSK
ncbi:hypothetical protein IGI04_031386 [Brassica rapa subsp. trilocularis]|uniref:Ribosomal protein L39e n=1 Tax=Brassica rapa subsp. trilocularis TaxID=1813537 RepID=A0ABQ7LW63_BRACM|nr:hypothetical protein IGI04_031386 [Brassica rapa subsp. trilocularis]